MKRGSGWLMRLPASAERRIISGQLAVDPGEIEGRGDLPDQMIIRNRLLQIERIEKLSLDRARDKLKWRAPAPLARAPQNASLLLLCDSELAR